MSFFTMAGLVWVALAIVVNCKMSQQYHEVRSPCNLRVGIKQGLPENSVTRRLSMNVKVCTELFTSLTGTHKVGNNYKY
jgi:hypothetical protein